MTELNRIHKIFSIALHEKVLIIFNVCFNFFLIPHTSFEKWLSECMQNDFFCKYASKYQTNIKQIPKRKKTKFSTRKVFIKFLSMQYFWHKLSDKNWENLQTKICTDTQKSSTFKTLIQLGKCTYIYIIWKKLLKLALNI